LKAWPGYHCDKLACTNRGGGVVRVITIWLMPLAAAIVG
jgi:hypothetical protein